MIWSGFQHLVTGGCLLRALKGAWHRWGPEPRSMVGEPLAPPHLLHGTGLGLRETPFPQGQSPGAACSSLPDLASASSHLPVPVLRVHLGLMDT